MIQKKVPHVVGIIPARYGSTRFPGKPLVKINGTTLIQRTYESAKQCAALDDLIVATDDLRILDHVHLFGGKGIMTSIECPTGTDRLVEVLKNDISLQGASIVVNIQGDEPCVEPLVIEKVVEILVNNPHAVMSTAAVKLKKEEAYNSSITKCVIDKHGNALYFSRALIPAGKDLLFKPNINYLKHLGIYGYRRNFLLHYSQLEPTPLQIVEDLEQLKVLEHGYEIKIAIVESESIGVDNPEDIQKIERLLCKQNTFS
jgi:3-deoxy-manno-octulosonate cytidylyltransferase (CMP-KDO synthetase)